MIALATLALRYPRIAGFLKRFGKWIALALAVVAIGFFLVHKKNQWEVAHYNRGFEAAAATYQARVSAANQIAANDTKQMEMMVSTFGGLATNRVQDITLKVEPKIERIKNEIAQNPVYRDCVVGDGVLDDLNASRDTVDAGIRASDPVGD
jgi:hypothetical protein